MDILIICDPRDKFTLNIKVAIYGESLLGIRPDHIVVLKPEENHPNMDRIKTYIREQVKLKLQKDRTIIYV